LVVFPGSVQEAQANPCQNVNPNGDNEADINCDFYGSLEIEEA
jgi:hypothetical protein